MTLFKAEVREKYLDCLVDNLERRFQDSGVLNAFTVFNPQGATKVKEKCDEEFATHGEIRLDTLTKHFSTTVDKGTLQLKCNVSTSFKVLQDLQTLCTRELMILLVTA